MTIDRRAFIAGTALITVTPAIGTFQPRPPAAADLSRPVPVSEGWSTSEGGSADQVWLRIGHG